MCGDTVRRRWTYDDLTEVGGPDPRRWSIVTVKDARGELTDYCDANAKVETGHGRLETAIDPFTRFDDHDPVRNNAKLLYASTERVSTPHTGNVEFHIDMTVETYRQVPFDLHDAYATVNLVDFTTGTVLDFGATNDTVFAIVERLAVAGVAGHDCYTHRVVTDIGTGPGAEHHYCIAYQHSTAEAFWYVDGECVYWARTPSAVDGFQLGMGIFSSRDLSRFARDERERGQGATACWSPWTIVRSVEPSNHEDA